ncbi:hypothetical protein BDW74DRAFT_173099 [Aspergillus multicolor]|uniref:Zn(II)2Cys6 transcription factor n=1 Tax=Aspergillus multicolor TaxID=41759 RepID=UPI003CCD699C
MSLKRGLERESCDFCFRRKIKCDRASRARGGYASCSQCDLRLRPCTLNCDDVRVHRRRRISPRPSRSTADHDLDLERSSRVSDILVSSLNDSELPVSPSPQLITSIVATLHPNTNTDLSIPASTTGSNSLWTDLDMELSAESISFLDEVFMQEFAPSNSTANIDTDSRPDTRLQNANRTSSMERAIANQSPIPYQIPGIDVSTLEAALTAYFDFASLMLPIIYRDALIADYESRQCSPALIFAVACRGCPFIQVPISISDKWQLQQRFARAFRLAFLEAQAQNNAASKRTIRLDDLEALALMVDFDYEVEAEADGTNTTTLHSQLGALFLTHQSLVLITLQYQILCPLTLERAAERKTLLLWHVYGLDAFYCLDHGVMPLIQEDIEAVNIKPPASERFIGHETSSYLDTILSLAAIARRIARTICSPGAKCKGIKPWDVENLYELLAKWRQDTCPPRLRFTGSLDPDSATREGHSQSSNTVNKNLLRGTVISLLEWNCYMEIERCLEVGIQERASAEGEALELRTRYETLKAADQIFKTTQYMEAETETLENRGQAAKVAGQYECSLVDLWPGILRNICCGAAYWFCGHVRKLLQQQIRDESTHAYHAKALSRQRAEHYVEKAAKLRDTAARAASHRDTADVVRRVDEQLHAMKELVERS